MLGVQLMVSAVQQVACEYVNAQRAQTAVLLLYAGAEINALDDYENTPLDLATRKQSSKSRQLFATDDHCATVRLLRAAGARHRNELDNDKKRCELEQLTALPALSVMMQISGGDAIIKSLTRIKADVPGVEQKIMAVLAQNTIAAANLAVAGHGLNALKEHALVELQQAVSIQQECADNFIGVGHDPLSVQLHEVKEFLKFYVSEPISHAVNVDIPEGVQQSFRIAHFGPALTLMCEKLQLMIDTVEEHAVWYRDQIEFLSREDRRIYTNTFDKSCRSRADSAAYDAMQKQVRMLVSGAGLRPTPCGVYEIGSDLAIQQKVADAIHLLILVKRKTPAFKELVKMAISDLDQRMRADVHVQHRPAPKDLFRLIEKTLMKYSRAMDPVLPPGTKPVITADVSNFDCSKVLDVAGCLLVCETYGAMEEAIKVRKQSFPVIRFWAAADAVEDDR